MRLKQWVELKGRGELTRLSRETRIHYTTIFELAKDHRLAEYSTAAAISKATGGAVSIAELCEPPATTSRPRKPSKAGPSKRKRTRVRRAPSSAVSAAPAARA